MRRFRRSALSSCSWRQSARTARFCDRVNGPCGHANGLASRPAERPFVPSIRVWVRRLSLIASGVHAHGGFQFGQAQLGQRYQGIDVTHHIGARNEPDSDPVGVGARRDVECLTVVDG